MMVAYLASSPLSEPLESTSWESNSTLGIIIRHGTVDFVDGVGIDIK